MRRLFTIAMALLGSVSVVFAKGTEELLHLNMDETATESQTRAGTASRGAGADTVDYGDVGADGFSILGDVWDWDFPEGEDPLMGWYSTDVTRQSQTYGRRVTEGVWDGHDNPDDAPTFGSTGALWIGAFEDEADDLCWSAGLGYGSSWCQRAVSPVISLTSQNNVTLNFKYFNDTEPDFDFTKIVLRRLPSGIETTLNPFDGLTGKIGLASPETNPPVGADYVGQISLGALEGATQFQLVFEMVSDGAWADDDGDYATEYGPFGVDDIVMAGGASLNHSFEASADGWTFQACPGIGSFLEVGNVADYEILDPCGCELSENILAFHDENQEHPYGQHEMARSNPTNLIDMRSHLPAVPSQLQVRGEWDLYVEMPRGNGVFYRPGWDYFPAECPATGEIGWSGRVGQNNFYYNPGPDCFETFNIATSVGVPQSAEQLRFIFEIYASCDAFGVTDCTFQTNFTPILDNVQLRGTKVPAAPAVAFSPGATTTRYQDGFIQNSSVVNPNGLGRADISYGGVPGEEPPVILGDSLHVGGPQSTPSTMWETRLWFKIRREGPGTKPARYSEWKNQVDAINGNPNPTVGFAYAWMDSVQTSDGAAFRNQFQSFCREDNLYVPASGELHEDNEIIRDGVLVPGTAIDYFVTANYTGTRDENYLLPDTTGGCYFEFEILPGWRNDGGLKFPCLLYVDATTGAETFIEAAFDELGLEHDRYDYNDATASWAPPFARGVPPSNNGVPLPQLLGYRGILVNIGTARTPMAQADFALFYDWLNTVICGGNASRQGLILNGDNMAFALENQYPALLNDVMGATLIQEAYYDTGDDNYCVQLETPLGGGHKYGTTNSQNPGGYDYDAWGNWCPQQFRFDVLGAVNGGVGNRAFVNLDGGDTNYAQIVRDVAGAGPNYRVVLDGVSYHHLSARDAALECMGDSAHIVDAIVNELAAGLEWIYGSAANIPSLCTQPCESPDVPEGPEITEARVTRLYQNSPNPFNPRTVLRFSLGQTGPVELTIFDVHGRKVRTLLNETREAGLHEVIWDGTDDAGHPVASGVFWSQLEAEGFSSNKKMVVVK